MQGIVIKSTGSWYIVKTDDGELLNCRIRGKFRMQDIKSTNPIVVGDKVLLPIYEALGSASLMYLALP